MGSGVLSFLGSACLFAFDRVSKKTAQRWDGAGPIPCDPSGGKVLHHEPAHDEGRLVSRFLCLFWFDRLEKWKNAKKTGGTRDCARAS
jgi:hypothetical protein